MNIRISARFEDPESADRVIRQLERLRATHIKIVNHVERSDDLPVNYPLKPEYLNGSHTAYLNGFPHILSGGPIYNEYFEPAERNGVTLSFCIPHDFAARAKSAVLQNGGSSVSVI